MKDQILNLREMELNIMIAFIRGVRQILINMKRNGPLEEMK